MNCSSPVLILREKLRVLECAWLNGRPCKQLVVSRRDAAHREVSVGIAAHTLVQPDILSASLRGNEHYRRTRRRFLIQAVDNALDSPALGFQDQLHRYGRLNANVETVVIHAH